MTRDLCLVPSCELCSQTHCFHKVICNIILYFLQQCEIMYLYMFSIEVKYKRTFVLRKCPPQGTTSKRVLHSELKKTQNKTTKNQNPPKHRITPVWRTCSGYSGISVAKGIALMHICTARLLHSQILVRGAMDNVTAPCCSTDLVDFVTTTLSSAQLQSPPLPKTVLCICENPTALMQDKWKGASSGRGWARHKLSW